MLTDRMVVTIQNPEMIYGNRSWENAQLLWELGVNVK
jgi:hypothetical protein